MQPQFYMYCYPWDLEDEGLEESIGRLAGEIGVDGINVAATTSEILQFRPRKPLEKRVFRTEAGAHFQPDSKHYSACRIKPQPAAWMKSRNALERIAKVCEKEKLKLRASVCCCVGRAMVKRYPFAACLNALGVPSERVLCATHPDVREYLATVVHDLSTNYALDAVELVGLRREMTEDYIQDEVVKPQWSDHAEALLRRCFCSACRQHAMSRGTKPDDVMMATSSLLEDWLDNPGNEIELSDSQSSSLNAYDDAQRRATLDLLSQIKTRVHCGLVLDFISELVPRRGDSCDDELLANVDRLAVSDTILLGAADDVQGKWFRAMDPKRLDVIVSASYLVADSIQNMVACTHKLMERPYHSVSFSHYGCAPQSMLDAIRQAIRFARRETR